MTQNKITEEKVDEVIKILSLYCLQNKHRGFEAPVEMNGVKYKADFLLADN